MQAPASCACSLSSARLVAHRHARDSVLSTTLPECTLVTVTVLQNVPAAVLATDLEKAHGAMTSYRCSIRRTPRRPSPSPRLNKEPLEARAPAVAQPLGTPRPWRRQVRSATLACHTRLYPRAFLFRLFLQPCIRTVDRATCLPLDITALH